MTTDPIKKRNIEPLWYLIAAAGVTLSLLGVFRLGTFDLTSVSLIKGSTELWKDPELCILPSLLNTLLGSLFGKTAGSNLLFLLGFYADSAACLYALRRLGFKGLTSSGISVVYAMLFLHADGPDLYSGLYFMAPIALCIAIEIFNFKYAKARISDLILMAAAGLSGKHYALFSMIFILCADISVMLHRGIKGRPLAPLFPFISLLGGTVISFIIGLISGTPLTDGSASPYPSEIYSFKLTQLLMPVFGHRVYKLRNIRLIYTNNSGFTNGDMLSLGTLFTGGLMLIILFFFFYEVSRKDSVFRPLITFALISLITGTTGGLGLIISSTVSIYYDFGRISVFLAFLCACSAAYLMDLIFSLKFLARKKIGTVIIVILTVFICFAGVFDETSRDHAPTYTEVTVREYANER